MDRPTPARNTAATIIALTAAACFFVAIALAWTVSLRYALGAAMLSALLIVLSNRIAPARGHSPPSPADDSDEAPKD
jgi:hypothetical protein